MPSPNSRHQTGDLKQGKCNNYAENTGHHHIKFSHPHNPAPKICEPHMDESKHKWTSLKLFQGPSIWQKKIKKKCIKAKSVQKKIFLNITQNCLVWDVKVKKKFSSTSQQKPEIMHEFVIFTPQMYVVDQRYSITSSNPETRWRWVVSLMPWPIYRWGKRPWYPVKRRLGESQNEMWRPGNIITVTVSLYFIRC